MIWNIILYFSFHNNLNLFKIQKDNFIAMNSPVEEKENF